MERAKGVVRGYSSLIAVIKASTRMIKARDEKNECREFDKGIREMMC